MITSGERIAHNHRDYEKRDKTLKFMRASFAGEDTVKELALDPTLKFGDVPAGMIGYSGERTPRYHAVQAGAEAIQYIDRARYPEVLSYVVAMATGKALSRAPDVKGGLSTEDLNSLFADGRDFNTCVLNVLQDYILTGGGGLFVNLDSSNKASIYHYTAESAVNWSQGANGLRLVVMENEAVGDNPFAHEPKKKRFVAGIDDETGKYFQELWSFELLGTGKDDKHAWVMESQQRLFPTMQQVHMEKIPFVPIGDWELRPIFHPLASTAKTYFRAYAEYAHLMFWGAMAQPFFKFTGENGGFWGVDDFSPDAVGDEADSMGSGQTDVQIKLGCTTPIMLRDGSMEWSSAPTAALSAQEKRLEMLRNEIGGLGARAFNPMANSQQTAETERLQQSGEGSLIHSAYREVALAITKAVRLALEWRGMPEAETFEFAFDSNIMFNFDVNHISNLQSLYAEGIIARRHVRDHLRRDGTLGPDETDEDIDAEIAAEGGIGGGFGDGADDILSEHDFLAAGINPSDDSEQIE